MSSKLYGKIVVAVFIATVALFTTACGGNGNNTCVNPAAPGCGGPTVVHFTTAHYVRDTSTLYNPDPTKQDPIDCGMNMKIYHKVLRNNAWVWDKVFDVCRNAMTRVSAGVYDVPVNLDFTLNDEYYVMMIDMAKTQIVGHTISFFLTGASNGTTVTRLVTDQNYGDYYELGYFIPTDANGGLR